jgi:hypothetical protein
MWANVAIKEDVDRKVVEEIVTFATDAEDGAHRASAASGKASACADRAGTASNNVSAQLELAKGANGIFDEYASSTHAAIRKKAREYLTEITAADEAAKRSKENAKKAKEDADNAANRASANKIIATDLSEEAKENQEVQFSPSLLDEYEYYQAIRPRRQNLIWKNRNSCSTAGRGGRRLVGPSLRHPPPIGARGPRKPSTGWPGSAAPR